MAPKKVYAFNWLMINKGNPTVNATMLASEIEAMYEAAGITPSDGPLVIPPEHEQMATISARRQGQTSLKEHCRIIPVSRPNGFWFALDTPGLTIHKTDFRQGKLGQSSVLPLAQTSGRTVNYKLDSYMSEFRLPNSLIADANELGVNLIDLLADDIARAEIANENAAITEQLALQASPMSTYSDLLTALMIDLPSRYYDGASIITNVDGLLWLATITDASGRLLIPPTAAQSDGLKICGKPVLAIDNAVLPTVDNKIPLFVGDLGQYCLYIERQDTEIMTSQDVWFEKRATAIRLTRRFCVLVDKAEAMRRYEITKGA